MMSFASPLLSGALFIAAGLYQFSAMKRACLTQCQHPFTFFLANWTAQPRGVFRLGVRQGFYCLGCCWAMMLLMFAVGVMSVIWMALLGIVMAIEKINSTMRFSRVIGAIFLAIGFAVIAASVMAHWPAKIGEF
jgi:predicted metal-binding membrane protein